MHGRGGPQTVHNGSRTPDLNEPRDWKLLCMTWFVEPRAVNAETILNSCRPVPRIYNDSQLSPFLCLCKTKCLGSPVASRVISCCRHLYTPNLRSFCASSTQDILSPSVSTRETANLGTWFSPCASPCPSHSSCCIPSCPSSLD